MLFAIDEAKVEEMLKASGNGYTVSIANIEPTIENVGPYYQNMSASGTISGHGIMRPLGTREHLMEIRSRIVASGEPLKNAEELAREIEEMRGGSR